MPGVVMEHTHATQSDPCIKDEDEDVSDVDAEGSDDGQYKSRPKLPQADVVMRSLKFLTKGLDAGIIDVDPEYQRDVVWTADRMTGLINSLMENYYIPPIILNKIPRSDWDGSGPQHTLVCVDGKQRLSSVRLFIKGMIPCHDYRGAKWWFCNTADKHRNVLSDQMQKEFLQKELVSFEFANLSPVQEEDLFARVQMGIPLTPAERMRASSGPWQELAKAFVNDFPDIFGLMQRIERGKDFQYALCCFSQIFELRFPSTSKGIPLARIQLARLQKFIEQGQLLDDDTRSHLAAVFRKFNDLIKLDPEVFRNERRRLKGSQTFAPIEMIAAAVLISKHKDERSDETLVGDIWRLRGYIRELLPDLRINEAAWKTVWSYVAGLNVIRGAVNDDVSRNTREKTKALQTRETRTEPNNAPPTPRLTPSSPVDDSARPAEAPKRINSGTKRKDQPNTVNREQQKRPRSGLAPVSANPLAVGTPGLPSNPLNEASTTIAQPISTHTSSIDTATAVGPAVQGPAQAVQPPQSAASIIQASKQKARRSTGPNPGVPLRRKVAGLGQTPPQSPNLAVQTRQHQTTTNGYITAPAQIGQGSSRTVSNITNTPPALPRPTMLHSDNITHPTPAAATAPVSARGPGISDMSQRIVAAQSIADQLVEAANGGLNTPPSKDTEAKPTNRNIIVAQETIDLTSDDETETQRQGLLATFGGHATNERHIASAKQPEQGTGRVGGFTAVNSPPALKRLSRTPLSKPTNTPKKPQGH